MRWRGEGFDPALDVAKAREHAIKVNMLDLMLGQRQRPSSDRVSIRHPIVVPAHAGTHKTQALVAGLTGASMSSTSGLGGYRYRIGAR